MRLCSYTFWFDLLKYPVDPASSISLTPYYHYIYYFIRVYGGIRSAPLLDRKERGRLIAAFKCLLDYYMLNLSLIHI